MVVDSSAMLAILFDEPDADVFIEHVRTASLLRMGAPTLLESSMAATRRFGVTGIHSVQKLIRITKIEIISFGEQEALLAIDAFERFGKGLGHPAQLNFGDCMSYAVAKLQGLPLLFKGDDFRYTDVECAI
jgi:ribonuclease VapC